MTATAAPPVSESAAGDCQTVATLTVFCTST